MKKLVLLATIGLLALAPLACRRGLNPISPPPPAATPTLIPTSTATSIPTATPTQTPDCRNISYTPINLGQVGFGGNATGTKVFRTLADWQAWSNAPAPVNFDNQILIVLIYPICPVTTLYITNFCASSSQITISANNDTSCAICNVVGFQAIATGYAIPQSNLPIVWNITNLACNQVTPSATLGFPFPTPTATPQ